MIDVKEVLDALTERGSWGGNVGSLEEIEEARKTIRRAARDAGIRITTSGAVFDSKVPERPWYQVGVYQKAPRTPEQERAFQRYILDPARQPNKNMAAEIGDDGDDLEDRLVDLALDDYEAYQRIIAGTYLHVERHGEPTDLGDGWTASEYVITRRGEGRKNTRIAWFADAVGLRWHLRGAPEGAKLRIEPDVQSDLDRLQQEFGRSERPREDSNPQPGG